MKLKYNLIAWSLLGFFAAACDPMDDIYPKIRNYHPIHD